MVLHNLWLGLPRFVEAFVVVTAIATLELNVAKTIIVPLFPKSLMQLRDKLLEVCPTFASSKIQYAARYLGVMLGPQGQEAASGSCCSKLKQRVLRIKKLQMPMTSAITYYNVYASSVYAHTCQYRAISKQLLVHWPPSATLLPMQCLEHA